MPGNRVRAAAALLWVAVLLAGAAFGGLWTVRNFLSEAGWSGQPGSFTVTGCQVTEDDTSGNTTTCSGRYDSDDGHTVIDPAYYQDGSLSTGATYAVLRGPENQIYIPDGPKAAFAAGLVFLLATLLGLGVLALGWVFDGVADTIDLVGTVLLVTGMVCAGLALVTSVVWLVVNFL
ncbi:hypothetical protein GXW83_04595 [Streptacidiphilus sp. PB12-B1b]|uniref:hypothetical protein n=1 Tax=Streptacidiphilus sp. PB12-B1b TaxID=2705012 RepID=UPI0015FBA830|nr:hypothetical protein [Streptacidiphilus sp. PB12-B1b]QMU75144.1 hypothetical protein GXW83_04595 [Streptacidiphilus sp. PB12-B1b]